jgi:hypothetical protein
MPHQRYYIVLFRDRNFWAKARSYRLASLAVKSFQILVSMLANGLTLSLAKLVYGGKRVDLLFREAAPKDGQRGTVHNTRW